MRSQFQTHYSTVVSTLALVIALGGTGYAATQITGADIKDGSVTGADVKDHSLLSRDLAPAAITAAAGPAWEISRNDFTPDQTSDPDGWVDVLSQHVPTGRNYVVMVTAQVVRSGSSSYIFDVCRLNTPQNNEYVPLEITPGADSTVVTLQSTMKGGGTATLACSSDQRVSLMRTTLIVTAVGALTQIP